MKKLSLPLLASCLLFLFVYQLVYGTPQATFTVNSTADLPDLYPGDSVCNTGNTLPGGAYECTFRAAVEEANAYPNADTIQLPGGVFPITDDAVAVTNTAVTINGQLNSTILDGTQSDSGILFVRDSANVTVNQIIFENGSGGCFPVVGCGMGGAITNDGSLVINDSIVRHNKTSANGGGIVNNNQLILENSTIEHNQAGQVGGGVYSNGYDYAASLEIYGSTLNDNLSTGGGAIYIAEHDALLDAITVRHNAAFGTPSSNSYGGGLSVKSGGDYTVDIIDSTFSDNYSEASGGAIFSGNTVVFYNSQLYFNHAAQRGGAIFSQLKPMTMTNSLVYSNTAVYDGGGWFVNQNEVALAKTAVFGNEAADGGGIYVQNYSDLTLENVTISGNNSSERGGGLFVDGDINANYVTLADNDAAQGESLAFGKNGDLSLGSSVVDGVGCWQPDGDFTSLGHNVIADTTGCTVTAVSGDQFNINPQLSPLQYYNSPQRTMTQALLPGSPALEAGDSGSCPATDQRGVNRPVNANCDAGAYERDPAVLPVSWHAPTPLPMFEHAPLPIPTPGITFQVNNDGSANNSDSNPGDGICDTGQLVGGQPECTFRAAVMESNALAGEDTILLPSGLYTITSSLEDITDHLIIQGTSYTDTILSAGSSYPLKIDYNTVATLRGVTMQEASRFISNYGLLTLSDCLVQGNSDSAIFTFYNYGDTMPVTDPLPEVHVERCIFRDNQGAFNGAAIYSVGALDITDSLFENNEATNGGAIYTTGGAGVTSQGDITIVNGRFLNNTGINQGGAIRSRWSRINISDSIFIGNQSTNSSSSSQGGALASQSWVTITNSYLSQNSAYYAGGALANGGDWNLDIDPAITTISRAAFFNNTAQYGGALTFEGTGLVSNSTFSQNEAEEDGGGILIAAQSDGVIDSVTLTDNAADSDGNDSGGGGGIHLSGGLWENPGGFAIKNSIVAGNSAFAGPDCQAASGNGHSLGHNLFGDISDCGVVTVATDLVGTTVSPLNPLLDVVTPIERHTAVRLPLAGSPAIDSGSCTEPDQRGELRPVCDRGAAEWTSPRTFLVNDAGTDEDLLLGDGRCQTATGTCTINAAIAEASIWAYTDTVRIPAGQFQSSNTRVWYRPLVIEGAGATQTIITGDNAARVFEIGEAENPDQAVTIQHLTIADGNSGNARGGGILNYADLTLDQVSVENNRARWGAGVANDGNGRLTINNSAIISNSASIIIPPFAFVGNGGGIWSQSQQPVQLFNSTVSGNVAAFDGGGIHHAGDGSLDIWHGTVANNEAQYAAIGGLYQDGSGTVTLYNTILADNNGNVGPRDCYGAITIHHAIIESYNVFSCSPSPAPLQVDPQLAPLAYNEGSTLNHHIPSSSPAVDAGDNAYMLPFDQRGKPRPADGDMDENAVADLGAVEYCGLLGNETLCVIENEFFIYLPMITRP